MLCLLLNPETFPNLLSSGLLQAASTGKSLNEDFSDTALNDVAVSAAHWDTVVLLVMAWRYGHRILGKIDSLFMKLY